MRITFLIVAGFLVIAGGGFYWLMTSISEDVERQYSQAAEEPLVDFAHLFAALLESDIESGQIDVSNFRAGFRNAHAREFLAKIYQLEKDEIFTGVYITDENGVVIFDSEGGTREGEDYSQYNDVYLARQGKYGVRSTRTDPDDPRTSVFYIAAPVYADGEMVGTLTVSRPETAMAPFAQESRERIIRSGAITACVVFFLVTFWAYVVLHPIRRLNRDAQLIAEGKQDRVAKTGVAELRALSISLENMRRELEGRHYVENYVQALTHELKSPLAAIRGAAELIDEAMPEKKRRQFLSNILAETTRSEDMVRRLVQLAAIEGQAEIERWEKIDLCELVKGEVEGLGSLKETKCLEMSYHGFEACPLMISGDPLMLRIAIRNILTNAFDFSPEESSIEVELVEEPDKVMLRVGDSGPGIPDYAVGRVFDRFYSLKNEVTGRKGSGIGLSFVQTTMKLHGGDVVLRNRDAGGTEALLYFSSLKG